MQVELVEPPAGAAIGERLRVDGFDCSQPDEQLNPKKKIFEAVSGWCSFRKRGGLLGMQSVWCRWERTCWLARWGLGAAGMFGCAQVCCCRRKHGCVAAGRMHTRNLNSSHALLPTIMHPRLGRLHCTCAAARWERLFSHAAHTSRLPPTWPPASSTAPPMMHGSLHMLILSLFQHPHTL